MPDAFLASLSQTPEDIAWFFASQAAQSFWLSNGRIGMSVFVLRGRFTSLGIYDACPNSSFYSAGHNSSAVMTKVNTVMIGRISFSSFSSFTRLRLNGALRDY